MKKEGAAEATPSLKRGLHRDFALLQSAGEGTDNLASAEPCQNEAHTGTDTSTDKGQNVAGTDSRRQGRDEACHIKSRLNFLKRYHLSTKLN